MIISASYRTDIPALYGKWFENRLNAGFCEVKNPYSGKFHRVSLLKEDVTAYVFWTKMVSPFTSKLTRLKDEGIPFMVTHTITNYPRPLENMANGRERILGGVRQVCLEHGKSAVVWRYDPVVFTDTQTVAWHVENFGRLAEDLAGYTDSCVVSFLQTYAKAALRMREAGPVEPSEAMRESLLRQMLDITKTHQIQLGICTQPLFQIDGVVTAKCIDKERLALRGADITRVRQKAHREGGCDCAESRDIGGYNSCLLGCAYCYAVQYEKLAMDDALSLST